MENKQSKNTNLLLYLLIGIAFSIGGAIAVNLHDLIHVKCATAGECFGASDTLTQLSLLQLWAIFPSTVAMVLLLLSCLLFIIIRPKAKPLSEDSEQDSIFDFSEFRKKLVKLCLASLGATALCLSVSYWIIAQG